MLFFEARHGVWTWYLDRLFSFVVAVQASYTSMELGEYRSLIIIMTSMDNMFFMRRDDIGIPIYLYTYSE